MIPLQDSNTNSSSACPDCSSNMGKTKPEAFPSISELLSGSLAFQQSQRDFVLGSAQARCKHDPIHGLFCPSLKAQRFLNQLCGTSTWELGKLSPHLKFKAQYVWWTVPGLLNSESSLHVKFLLQTMGLSSPLWEGWKALPSFFSLTRQYASRLEVICVGFLLISFS